MTPTDAQQAELASTGRVVVSSGLETELGMTSMEINMKRNGEQCCICGKWDLPKWGVPVSALTGAIISNDSEAPWGAKPACRACFDKHAKGEFVGKFPKY